eukprot:gene4062-8445_t
MALPVQPGDYLPWALGFRDQTGRYLTVENFGDRLNINGKTLKTKQIFQLEQDEGAGSKIFVKTPNGKYLTAKADGTWGADAESKGINEEFEVQVQPDGSWALKSSHGYYCGGNGEKVDAFTKEAGPDRLFVVHLAIHPQVCIWNVNRKRFIHLIHDSLAASESIPWGAESMVVLTFFSETGKYGLQACDSRFLKYDGTLTDSKHDPAIQFTLDMRGGQIAFRASNDKYLTCLGASGICKATKQGPPGKDELFVLEDSHPQVKMTSFHGKIVSIRSSIEATANQTETTFTECFQIEIDEKGLWNIRCNNNTFWYINDSGGVMTDGPNKTDSSTKFALTWLNNSVAIKASNGKYVAAKRNGALVAKDTEITPESTFVYELINRPLLALRGQHGFVSTTDKSRQLMSTSSKAYIYHMHVKGGICQLRDPTAGHWEVLPDSCAVSVDGKEPSVIYMEFVSLSKIALKRLNADGSAVYMRSQQNSAITWDGDKVDPSTTFEF